MVKFVGPLNNEHSAPTSEYESLTHNIVFFFCPATLVRLGPPTGVCFIPCLLLLLFDRRRQPQVLNISQILSENYSLKTNFSPMEEESR